MLLVIITPAALYMAADSRQYPSGMDTVQKVFLVGNNAIVGHSGIGIIPLEGQSDEVWDAAVEMQKICAETPVGLFGEQLGFIQQHIQSSLTKALTSYHGSLPNAAHLAILLARREDGTIYFVRQEFRVASILLEPNKWGHPVEAAPVQWLVSGKATSGAWWDVPPGCEVLLPNYLDLSPQMAFQSISAVINGVAAQSTQCSERIGGAIRAAVIDDVGVRWLLTQ